jgi:hypothetical protein
MNEHAMKSTFTGIGWSILLIVLSACSEATEKAITATPVCEPSPLTKDIPSGLIEAKGTASEGEIWALIFLPDATISMDSGVKIVWKMTGGKGDIKLTAEFADGTLIEPTWGPIAHGGSSWQRPGQEWGSEFVFPKPGCWRIIARRTLTDSDATVTGEVDVWVEEKLP